MSEAKQLAGIFPWPKTALRCGIYTCRNQASYMLRHSQGLFGDTHFPLCKDCAEDIVRNLPVELRALVPVEKVMVPVTAPDGELAFGSVPSSDQWPELPKALSTAEAIRFLTQSAEIQALAKGEKVDPEVRQALGSLIEMLAEAGAEVEAPAPEQISVVTDGTQGNRMPDSSLLPGGSTTESLTPKTDRKPATMMEAAVMAQGNRPPDLRKRPAFDDADASRPGNAERDALKCPVCGAGPFKSKPALTGHINSKHGGKKK